VLPSINQAVHATRSALIAPGSVIIAANGVSLKDVRIDADVPMSRDFGDCLFPVRVEILCPMSGKSGWLLLGPRPDGSLYGKEDFDAIEYVKPAIRHALAWATAREAMRNEQRRQWQSLRRDVGELRRCLAAQEAAGNDAKM
jgi:hypothetical protein